MMSLACRVRKTIDFVELPFTRNIGSMEVRPTAAYVGLLRRTLSWDYYVGLGSRDPLLTWDC